MPDKVTISTITAGHGSMDLINDNFDAIADWINTYGLDISGTGTNTITANIDMNGNSLLNYVLANENGWSNEGDWATTTAYIVGDVVFVTVATDATYGGASYYCLTAHTSGTFSTDYITSGYWQLVAARGAQGASGAGSGDLLSTNNLSDVASLTTSRSNLGFDGASGVVATGDLADNAVTLAKLNGGTAGALLGFDASGDPAEVAPDTAGYVLTDGGAGVAPTFQANTAAPTVVTQDQMEAATNNTAMVTAAKVQYHPGIAKAWGYFDGTATGSNPPTAGYNVTSVERTATGKYTVTFTTALGSANYAVICNACDTTDNGANIAGAHSLLAGSFVIDVNEDSDASATDDENVFFVVYGGFPT